MNLYRPSCAVVIALIAMQVLGPAVLWAADQRGIRVEANRRVVIAAISGERLLVKSSGETKTLQFRDVLTADDEIDTGDRTLVEVLIGNRAVVTLGQGTTAQFTVLSDDQATVQVKKGIVRVAASAAALGAQGTITIQTATGLVQTRGGILRVMVDAPSGSAEQTPIGEGRPYRATYAPNTRVAAAGTRGDIIQVEEGTAEIPGAGPGGKTLTVKSGQSVTMQSGQAGSISGLVSQGGMRAGVLASAGHNRTPKEGVDNLVALQVNQATALGKALTGAAETGGKESGKKDESKNAINGATGGVTLATLVGFLNAPPTSGSMTFNSSRINLNISALVVNSAFTGGLRDQTTDNMRTPNNNLNELNESIGTPQFARLTVNKADGISPVTKIGEGGGNLTGIDQTGKVADPTQPSFKEKFGMFQDSSLNVLSTTYQVQARLNNGTSPDDGTSSDNKDVTIFAGVKYAGNTTVDGSLGTNLVQTIGISESPWTSNDSDNTTDKNINIVFSNNAVAIDNSTVTLTTNNGLNGTLAYLKAPDNLSSGDTLTISAPSTTSSLIQLTSGTSTSQSAVVVDRAILLASAPIVALYGTGPTNNPVMSSMTTAGDFMKLLNGAKATVTGDALVALSASNLVIAGALANLSDSSSLIVTNLATLANGSSLTASTLASLTGSSFLHVTGSLVNFVGTGNTLAITSTCGGTCFQIGGIPILLTGIATPETINVVGGNSITIAPNYNVFSGSTPALSTFDTKPLLTIDGLGNTVKLGS